MNKHLLTSTADIKAHLFGCDRRATFTLQSARTGTRFTYRLRRERDNFFFIDVLTGPENETDYSFVGTVQKIVWRKSKESHWTFQYSGRSNIDNQQSSVLALDWFIERLNYATPLQPTSIAFYYSGYCSVCGRMLTVPESLARGVGPKCAEKAQTRI